MGEVTKIQWCDHTFNPWVGCSKVAPGCANCYAEADMDKRRHFAQWGPDGTRVKTSSANWQKPLRWNREAEREYETKQAQWVQDCCAGYKSYTEPQPHEFRSRVFCSSLADVFEDWGKPIVNTYGQYAIKQGYPVSYAWQDAPVGGLGYPSNSVTLHDLRQDLFGLIDSTPHLDWLLLTKRPENIHRMVPCRLDTNCDGDCPMCFKDGAVCRSRKNIWLGTSVSDQATADKAIPELLKCRDLAPVLFLSIEPLLGPVNLARFFAHSIHCRKCHPGGSACKCSQIDWVIVGGESGPNSRPCNVEWIRSIVSQCKAAGVPCFVKQLGANPTWSTMPMQIAVDEFKDFPEWGELDDKKGGDPAEWPEDLRVREFPQV